MYRCSLVAREAAASVASLKTSGAGADPAENSALNNAPTKSGGALRLLGRLLGVLLGRLLGELLVAGGGVEGGGAVGAAFAAGVI